MIYNSNYTTEQGHHCLLTCVANYARRTGNEIPETDMFLKIKGYEIRENMYGLYEYKVVGVDILDQLQMPYEMKQFSEKQDLWKELSDLVREEKQIITFMDAGKLKYSSAFAYAVNIGHMVNVIGVNDEKQVYVSDGYIATAKGSCFEGWIDFEEFAASWSGSGYSYVVVYPEKISDGWRDFSEDLKTVFSGQSANNERLKQSIHGIIGKLRTITDNAGRQEALVMFNNYFRMSGLLFVRDYFIELMKKYCTDTSFAEEYSALYKEWSTVSCLIIKLRFIYSESMLDSVGEKIDGILDRENEIYGRLACVESADILK